MSEIQRLTKEQAIEKVSKVIELLNEIKERINGILTSANAYNGIKNGNSTLEKLFEKFSNVETQTNPTIRLIKSMGSFYNVLKETPIEQLIGFHNRYKKDIYDFKLKLINHIRDNSDKIFDGIDYKDLIINIENRLVLLMTIELIFKERKFNFKSEIMLDNFKTDFEETIKKIDKKIKLLESLKSTLGGKYNPELIKDILDNLSDNGGNISLIKGTCNKHGVDFEEVNIGSPSDDDDFEEQKHVKIIRI